MKSKLSAVWLCLAVAFGQGLFATGTRQGIALGETTEPPSLHQLEWEAHRGDVAPDKTRPSGEQLAETSHPAIVPLQPRVATAGTLSAPTKAIFGYLPYWERVAGTPNIKWNLLTHLACFSIEVNSNGTLGTMNGWPTSWTYLINTAHANGVKGIPVFTNFSPSSIYSLITSTSAKNTFFNNVKNQILAGNADGVNIDFEGSNSSGWRSHINAFMLELTNYLHDYNPAWEVSFAGAPVDWDGSWDFIGLAASCDYVFIMAYNWYGSWSTKTGACAPYNSVKGVVEKQYAGVPTAKLILGLPYYGGQWRTATSAANSSVLTPLSSYGWVGSTRFRNDALDCYDYGLLWDAPSKTPWYRWHDGSTWRQVWFDNDASLGLKFQLAQDHNYKGVGMWALNYDGDRPELWDELARRFSPDWIARPPDLDGDGDVDQADFGKFQLWVTDPGVMQWDHSRSPGRLDRDMDIDADDMTKFIQCLSGPGVTPLPNCAQ